MKLMIQPEAGLTPLLKSIHGARSSIHIAIFRFDRKELEKALTKAVGRGVAVHALVAHVNGAGEESLRKLELRLLAEGVTVTRTPTQLLRYHGKYMIIDRKELHILAFNFTHLDSEQSRSFGVISTNRALVQDALKLFEADAQRLPYTPATTGFVVSPINARKQLAGFIKGAKGELLIYDPKVSDPVMIRLLEERSKAGVSVKIIGRLTRRADIEVRKLPRRLHTRTMVRDNRYGFIGSQSLRDMELDSRREVGVIFRDPKVLKDLAKVFHEDWEASTPTRAEAIKRVPAERVAKKIAKALVKEIPPVAPVLEEIIEEMGRRPENLSTQKVEESVKDAVKQAVREAVKEAVDAEQKTGGK